MFAFDLRIIGRNRVFRCDIFDYKCALGDSIFKIFNLTDVSLDENEFDEDVLYHEGYFYSQVTGGDMSSGCTVVNKIEKIDNNTYKLYCDVYFTGADEKGYYSFNAQQAEEESKKEEVVFVKTKSGTAIIEADDINDRSTYILKEYQMQKV